MPSEALERANATWRELLKALEGLPLDEVRARVDEFYEKLPLPEGARLERVDAGGVPAIWVTTPESIAERTILYFHGGGYILGGAEGYCKMTSRIARAAQARVLVADYRLAPENAFPAAVQDGIQVYAWLLKQGVRTDSVAIAGDSAGGGLTLATMISVRDAGGKLPAAAAVISPWIDLAVTGGSIEANADRDSLISRSALERFANEYLQGQDPRSPLASPLYADLYALPPLLIQVGTAETLLDDARRLDERARNAGVDATLDVAEEMPHVWHVFASFLPEAQQAIDRLGSFVRRHTEPAARRERSGAGAG
jgi:epsilon-lactone hydrolase